jgi:hypothetical protein
LQQRHIDQEIRVVLRNFFRQRLSRASLQLSDSDLDEASAIVAAMTDDQRKQAAGLYFVREYAALWLFDSRPTYFR